MALQRVETDAIQDDAITTDKIAPNAVAAADIAADAITNVKVAAGAAIDVAKISGLGTAAALTAGTAANNVVQLDGSGRLPAVSGANLTGVSTDTSAMENNIAILAFKTQSANNLAKFNLVDQVIDEYKDDAGLATKTNTAVSGITATTGYVASVNVTDGDDSYTKMLLHMEDTALASTGAGHNSGVAVNPTTLGASSRSSTYSKFGSYSMGTTGGSGIKFAYLSAWNDWGSQDITIDFWYRFATFPTSPGGALFCGDVDSQYIGIRHHHPTINSPQAYNSGAQWGSAETGSKNNYLQNTWYHIAVVHNSGVIKCYIDGVEDLSVNTSGSCVTGSGFNIMGDWGGAGTKYPLAGCYMDEFRLSVGIARWTSNFTPYTEAYGTVVANATGTVISTANTALSAPTTGDIVLLMENAYGTATLNTDIKAYISRNGGTGWDQVTLQDKGSWGTNKKILTANNVAFSNSASGTDMRYKIEWANQSAGSKVTRVHATSLAWA